MARDIGQPVAQQPRRMISGGTPLDVTPHQQQQAYIYDASGSVWMGPGAVPIPSAPPTEEPRRFDYLAAWNLYRQPASAKSTDGGIDFSILREFAKQTLVRLAIETCKDLDAETEYTFTLLPEPGEKTGQTRKRAMNDSRIKQVTDFFRYPDGLHDFADWRRLAWEEILVCDNLSVWWRPFAFGQKNRGRVPHSLRIISGDTIEPAIDDAGYEPSDGIAYEQWIKGSPRIGFTAKELLYGIFNPRVNHVFGFGPVEQILWYINILIRRDMKKLAEYTDGNIPAGLWTAPDTWTPTQIREAQTWLDVYMQGDPVNRAKLIFMPGGPRPPVFPGDKVQTDPFDDLLTRLVAYAFSVSVSSLLKQQNRATGQQNQEQAEEEGEVIRRKKMTRFLNRCVRWAFGYDDVIAVPKQTLEQDAEKQSVIDNRDVASGIKQLSEIRDDRGLEPIREISGKSLYRLTTGEYVPFESVGVIAQPDGDGAPEDNTDDTPPEFEAATKLSKAVKKKSQVVLPLESRTSTRSRLAY